MIDVEKLLKEEKGFHKYGGVAPEGFVLVHEKTLEDLKLFDNWMLWTENKLSIRDLNIKNFDKYK